MNPNTWTALSLNNIAQNSLPMATVGGNAERTCTLDHVAIDESDTHTHCFQDPHVCYTADTMDIRYKTCAG